MKIHKIIFLVLTPVHFSVAAQNIQKISSTESIDFYLRPYNHAERVGSAVMVKIYAINRRNEYAYSHRVLASCDGKWVSTTFFDSFHIEKMSGPQDFIERLDRKEPENERIAIEKLSTGASDLKYLGALSKRVGALCRDANQEPRNTLIPISSSVQDGDLGKTHELVTGTRSKVGKEIDVWLRATEYKRSEIKNSDGSTFVADGRVQYSYELTRSYTLQRTAFNCEHRKLATYEVTVYTAGSVTPNSEALDRDKTKLLSAVPGSIGESQLDWVCALYSSSPS